MSGNFSRLFYIFQNLYTVFTYIFFHFNSQLTGNFFQILHNFSRFFQFIFDYYLLCTKINTYFSPKNWLFFSVFY